MEEVFKARGGRPSTRGLFGGVLRLLRMAARSGDPGCCAAKERWRRRRPSTKIVRVVGVMLGCAWWRDEMLDKVAATEKLRHWRNQRHDGGRLDLGGGVAAV